MRMSYLQHFGYERGMMYVDPFSKKFRNFETRRIFYGSTFWWTHKWKIQKNRFFQIHLKFDPNEFRYRFRVQNGSKTSQGLISGHISGTRTIPATWKKFEFLAQIVILEILIDFWWCAFWPIIWPEVAGNVIYGRKWLLWTPRILLHTLDDHLWWLDQILKNLEKSSFLLQIRM